jgi:hypothetical protein
MYPGMLLQFKETIVHVPFGGIPSTMFCKALMLVKAPALPVVGA